MYYVKVPFHLASNDYFALSLNMNWKSFFGVLKVSYYSERW